jgi:hypothetical protein
MALALLRAAATREGRVRLGLVLASNALLAYSGLALYFKVSEAASRGVQVSTSFSIPTPVGTITPFTLVVGLAALLLLAVLYYSFTLDRVQRSIVSLYILLALAVGVGPELVDHKLLLVVLASTMAALLSHGPRRAIHVSVLGKDWRGKYYASRGNPVALAVYLALTSLVPMLAAVGASVLVLSAARAVEALELSVPPPLPDLWDLFKSTRIGVFLVLLAVIWFSVWLVNNVFETLILIAVIKRDQALELARSQVLRDHEDLSRFRSGEDRVSTWILGSIAALLLYPLIYSSYSSVAGPLYDALELASVPSWLSYLAGLAALMVILWASRRFTVGLMTSREALGRRWALLSASLSLLLIAYLAVSSGWVKR